MSHISFNVLTTVVDDQPTLTGTFKLSSNSLDYKNPNNDDFTDYFSDKPVRVIDGNVLTVDLIDACYNLHSKTGYWGAYIEQLEYRPDTNSIEVHFGS